MPGSGSGVGFPGGNGKTGKSWPESGSSLSSPRGVDRGDIATGGGDRGGGSSPPRAKWYPKVPLRPPTPPALRAPPPPPPRGEGSHGDSQREAVAGSSPGSPHGVDRGGIATGVGTGEGVSPSPPGGYPYVPPQSPRPPEGGQYVGIPGKSRLPGRNPRDSVKKDRYSPPLSVPVIENHCIRPPCSSSRVQGPLR